MGSSPARPRLRKKPGLPSSLPGQELLCFLGRLAGKYRTRAFLVGGPVRDILLGRSGPDTDIAVESDAQKVGREIAARVHGRFVFHSRFLTGTVTLPDSTHIDITQTRTETYSRPATLPRVKPASIENDLIRRDFTINALALEISPGNFGNLLDPHSGQQDLARRLVRILHPNSFIDDPTRIFRAIRFAIRFGFEIELETLRLMRNSIKQGCPALLTPERVLYELRLICSEPLRLQMLEATVKEKLLQTCFGWQPSRDFLSGLQGLASKSTRPDLLYVFLLSELPVTDRFPVTKSERESVQAIRNFSAIRARLIRVKRPSTIYRLLHPVPEPALRILALLESREVASVITLYLEQLSSVTTTVTGRELRKLGLVPGPKYRTVLNRLLYARLDCRVKSSEQELDLARNLVRKMRKQ